MYFEELENIIEENYDSSRYGDEYEVDLDPINPRPGNSKKNAQGERSHNWIC